MYHYFYKITNKINGKYYYGVHNTNNLNDGYFGSGKVLKLAYQKYGIENFEKDILEFFDTEEEAFAHEKEIVNEELIKKDECYNVQIGGKYFNTIGKIPVKDKDGKHFWVFRTDEIYVNGDVVPIWKDKQHRQESRDKTRKTMTPNESNNDRIWVCKDGKVKYLRKVFLDEYISNGWSLGRVGYKPRKNGQGKEIE